MEQARVREGLCAIGKASAIRMAGANGRTGAVGTTGARASTYAVWLRSLRQLAIAALLALTLTLPGARAGAQTAPTTVGVYYVGPEDAIAEAIALAAPLLVRVDQPDLAQVIVINNAPLQDSLRAFGAEIQQGRVGLVLFCGPSFPQTAEDLRALLGVSAFGLAQAAGPETVQIALVEDPLQPAIAWQSAPEIHARTLVNNPNLLRPIVTAGADQAVIQRVRGREQTQVLIVGGWFAHPSNENWLSWAYFDYLVYHLISDAAATGRTLPFVDYPRSPTLHRSGRLALVGVGVGLMASASIVYYLARRRLYLRPGLADTWQQITVQAARPSSFETWQSAGFHRPLTGFLTSLPLNLVLLLPLIAYRIYLLPEVLFPDSQGFRIWEAVAAWSMILWILLDAGTATSAIRHYSAYHIHFPQRAARHLQFYVWWQLLSGAAQVGVISILTATALPALGQAHLTYAILARTVLQIPGFLDIFMVAFAAHQRFDYQQSLMLFTAVSVPWLQAMALRLIVPWGSGNPEIGAGSGGNIALAVGILVAEGLSFLLGAYLHVRRGRSLSALFLPTFDKEIVRESLTFGVPWALATAIPVAGYVLQTEVFRARLTPDDLSLDSWRLVLMAVAGFEILLSGLYRAILPALSEARALDYRTLMRYTASQGIRYGGWFSFFLFAALAAIGERLLLTPMAARYADLQPWLMAMLAWGALQWTAWLPERMLEAAGRPGLIAVAAFIEQAVRIGGGLVLIPLWGMTGVLVAWGTGLLIRAALVRVFAERTLVQVRIYVWQALIVPAAGAIILYQLLRLILASWSPVTWVAAGWVTAGVFLIGLLLYGFLTGVLGGWDAGGVADLRQAARLGTISQPYAWILMQAVRVGTRISPLHGRFPLGLYDWAQKEANALTLAQSQPER